MARAVQGYLLKARLLTTQFQFAPAEKVSRRRSKPAPDSQEAHYAFGSFTDLNHFTVARREYQRALEIAQRNDDPALVATTLNNLGRLD